MGGKMQRYQRWWAYIVSREDQAKSHRSHKNLRGGAGFPQAVELGATGSLRASGQEACLARQRVWCIWLVIHLTQSWERDCQVTGPERPWSDGHASQVEGLGLSPGAVRVSDGESGLIRCMPQKDPVLLYAEHLAYGRPGLCLRTLPPTTGQG